MLLSPIQKTLIYPPLGFSLSHWLIFVQLCELPVSSPCFFWLFSAALCVSDLSPFSGMSRLGVYLLSPQKCFYCSVIVIVLFVFNICTCKTHCYFLSFLSPSFSHTLSLSLLLFFFFGGCFEWVEGELFVFPLMISKMGKSEKEHVIPM